MAQFERLREQFHDVAFTTPTPFDDGGARVDHDALSRNLDWLESEGAQLFIPCGNTGEYYALSDEERVAVVETHAETLGEETTVVGGVAGSTKEATALARAYEERGADAVMVMHPDHTYAHERGLVEYYRAVADATDLGTVLYKRGPGVPRRVVEEVTAREDVVAVKFATDDVDEFAASASETDHDVAWVNGIAERYALSFAVEGAVGFTTGIGNFVPRASLALFEALDRGEFERARTIRDDLRPLEELRQEPGEDNSLGAANNVPVVKYGQELAGLYGGPVREPLVELPEADRQRVETCYETVRDAEY